MQNEKNNAPENGADEAKDSNATSVQTENKSEQNTNITTDNVQDNSLIKDTADTKASVNTEETENKVKDGDNKEAATDTEDTADEKAAETEEKTADDKKEANSEEKPDGKASEDKKETSDKEKTDDKDDNIIHSDSSGEKKDNLEEVKKDTNYNGVKTEEEDEEEEETGKKKPFRVLRGIIYTVCILLFSVLLAVLILLSVTDYVGMFRPYKSANVRIPAKATTGQVADILQDKGIIRSALVFKFYAKKTTGLQNGTFTLNSNMSYNEIIKTLKSTKNRSTVSVTIPEGYSVTKIAEVLEKKEVCSKESFLAACNSDKIDFDFQKDIPSDSKRLYRLEGYLFPDTYEFYLDTPADTVVKKMLTTFDKRVDKDLRAKIKSSGMSVDDVVKLASVIQAETGGSKEMANVSSVFHNRLENGYQGNKMLQSDVTVLYGTNIIEPTLNKSQDSEKLADSYNTYKVTGLPAGAINNPGIAAIKAAVSPSKTNYYFFVTDKKGNYYYARTYSQHKINCQKALKNGGAVGTDTK